MPTIYLAGFDVFRRDAVVHGEALKALCATYGCEGLYPLDNALPAGLSGPAAAQWIYQQNLALIVRADMVMANLDDFRGLGEPDAGTAFEVGYAVALGKPVWGYSSDSGTLLDRVAVVTDAQGRGLDARGYVVEDFDLGKNLMLACAARMVHGGARECLQAIVRAAAAAAAAASSSSSASAAG